MNAPLQPRIDATWRRYLPAVDAMHGGASVRERRVRCALMLLRDHAVAIRRTASWDAAPILDHIISLTVVHGSAAMSAEELEIVNECTHRLFSVATHINSHGPGRDR